MIETYGTIALSLAPLIIAALITVVHPLPLKQFQGVYLGLAGVWIVIHALLIPGVWIGWLALIVLGGEIAHILMVGFAGRKLGPANHSSILLAVGLFPWYIGIAQSIAYALLAVILGAVYSNVQFKHQAKKFDINSNRPDVMKKKLSEEDWLKFKSKASVILAAPFAVAAILMGILYPFI